MRREQPRPATTGDAKASPQSPDGGEIVIRAVRPDDARRIAEMVERSSPRDIMFRFGTPMRRLPTKLAQRLAEIDLSRDMAFVGETDGELLGVARMARDAGDDASAEIAIMVRSDAQHHGLGRLLLERLLDHARDHRVERLWGLVRPDNALVLTLAREAGFSFTSTDLDGVRIERVLV